MANLNELTSWVLKGKRTGAYMEPTFQIEGIDASIGLTELLTFLLENTGSTSPELEAYPNDEAAGIGGVEIGKTYILSSENTYGLPEGLHKIRII